VRPPFASLCPVDWSVWADWNRDHDRVKAAGWADKVSKALLKFHLSGSEPRMLLYHGTKQPGSNVSLRYLPLEPKDFDKYGFALVRESKWGGRWVSINNCYWIRYRAKVNVGAGFPGDLRDPWKWWRLSQKFFMCVVSRSRGITDTVLQ